MQNKNDLAALESQARQVKLQLDRLTQAYLGVTVEDIIKAQMQLAALAARLLEQEEGKHG